MKPVIAGLLGDLLLPSCGYLIRLNYISILLHMSGVIQGLSLRGILRDPLRDILRETLKGTVRGTVGGKHGDIFRGIFGACLGTCLGVNIKFHSLILS